MSNIFLQTVFSDVALGGVKGVINTLVPAKYRWVALTVVAVAAMVDDLDRVKDLTGPEKQTTIITAVKAALDEADDVPGWRDLSEGRRDALIGALAEVCYFAVICAKTKGIPAPSDYNRLNLYLATGDIVEFMLDLLDGVSAEGEEKSVGAVAVIEKALDSVARAEMLTQG